MNLIVLHPDEVAPDGGAVLADERANHIRNVLRAEPGKRLRIGLLNGPLGEGLVAAVEKDQVVLQCTFSEEIPLRPSINLLLAMPRPKVMKRLWAQLSALGVGRIVLLNANKVERCYFDSHIVTPDFYNPLLREGLQQARCTRLPKVMVRPRFKPFMEDEFANLSVDACCLLAHPGSDKDLSDWADSIKSSKQVWLAIGPEGGWTEYEMELLISHGFNAFTLGPRILRTDTACIGLLAAVQQWMT